MRGELTDRLVNDLAVVMDVVVDDGSIDERYQHLRICLETKLRYESGRLR